MSDVHRQFGGIDIYLFDQLNRGRINPGTRVFEVGCGHGRNLVYFLRNGYPVAGIDEDASAIAKVQELSRQLSQDLPTSNFRVESIEQTTFSGHSADFVISSAVQHFARDDDQFWSMLSASWRLVSPGGILFCRLASTIGMERRFEQVRGRRFTLPDGSERYLVDTPLLLELTGRLGGELVDVLKTTVVQDQRCMTTWIVKKVV
jgi:tellurite methyltransferase